MHSRIFQLEKAPVKIEDYIDKSCIGDWFVSEIADYVDDDLGEFGREKSIDWLMEHIGKVSSLVGDKLTFTSDIRPYFKEKYEEFMATLKALVDCTTLNTFSLPHGIAAKVWNLNRAYCDKSGFYIYNDYELMGLDTFMRSVRAGETYYIGAVLDYHI